MLRATSLLSSALLAVVYGQQIGTNTPEVHPQLTSQTCTTAGGCVTQQTSIVLDANWRWLHTVGGYTNCYTGNTWNTALCPDPVTCAANCALDGADYAGTYGITTSGNALTLKFVTGANVGSRVYLMNGPNTYQLFKLVNQEFTFDVDMSNLPCGLNGALYLTEMDADGGVAKYPTNKAGAQYGTGYCDSQCPHDIKFINGQANILGWTPDANDANAGAGQYGTCCNEMDIWEANSNSAAYTPHVCSVAGQYRCSGTDCGDGSLRYNGVCDKDGCDFNSFRMGNQGFLGPGKTVDTTQKFTVVTQFISSTNTSTGTLSEIRRLYVQNGKVIPNSVANIPNVPAVNSITDAFCNAQKTEFGDTNSFEVRGGLTTMGQSLQQGMVLSMSVWDDYTAQMLWLDSDYPTTGNPATPGVARGPCATTSGAPPQVEAQSPGASVTFSNIRWGDIGSTYTGTLVPPPPPVTTSSVTPPPVTTSSVAPPPPPTTSSVPPPPPPPPTTTSSSVYSSPTPPAGTVPHWGQCGGIYYTGPVVCAAPYTCQFSNPWYSQCL